MTGEFRRVTRSLNRELIESVAYDLREARFPLERMSGLLSARRETINAAVLAHARARGLPVPKGYQSWRIPPEQIIGIPPRER